MKRDIEKIARGIKLLILDVDGVLTDGSIVLDNEGNELKSFHVRDGHGIKLLIRHGIEVAIITGRVSRVVQRRAQELGIKKVYQKCYDKVVAYEEIKESLSVKDDEIAYMGDDIVDIPVMKRVALPVAVADAHEDAKRYAILVTKNRGGRGAVRELAEVILKAKGHWEDVLSGYADT